jgi:glutamate/tyrosine decarboxylase-like PLP-dependent enzyme
MQAEDISNNPELVSHLDHLVREHPDFEVLREPTVDFYGFRYVPNALAAQQNQPDVQQLLDRLNEEIVDRAQNECFAPVSMVQVLGRVAMRVSIYAGRTAREDIDATFDAIARWGWLCNKKYSSTVVI